MDRTIDAQSFERRLRTSGIRSFLPDQIAPQFPVDGTPTVEDLLSLPNGVLAIVRCGTRLIALPLADASEPRRARAGDGVFADLARAVGDELAVGRFVAASFSGAPPGSRERAISADQSNDSVVVDETSIVKIQSVPPIGLLPAVELPIHLKAVGFGETPALRGWLRWSSPEGSMLLATVTELLPEAHDGWNWHVGLVEEIADGGRPPAAWQRPAVALGALVARLHTALATPSYVFGTPRSSAAVEDVRFFGERANGTLEEAIELIDGAEGERLRGWGPAIRQALAEFGEVATTPISVIHGDLHVGQLLPWRDGFAVIDFEGNPVEWTNRRVLRGPPVRDVASVVRSIDHVGRIVQRRRPDRARDIASWVADARAAFLDSYRAQLGNLGSTDLFDERLLHPFEVAQECHEYVYAARYLPHWRSVPDLAMPRLLGEA